MDIIHAHINGSPLAGIPDRLKLIEYCHSFGLQPPVYISSAGTLENLLQADPQKPVLLITNFPPNSSYPDNRRVGNSYRWEADSYSRSLLLFESWSHRYRFKGICIITGAPVSVLADEQILSVLPGIPVHIMRKKKWLHDSVDYPKVYTLYMQEMIRKHFGLKA
ncbi:MAG: hypothetical protein ACK4VN_06760 [Bacteroidales bacterium]